MSVVIPVYKGQRFVKELVRRLHESLDRISSDYEIIMVDDRSPDDGWPLMVEEARADPRVIAIRLSRNFGQHAAITAGLERARGRWNCVMDCDLQDAPEDIVALYHEAQATGAQTVIAVRKSSGLGLGRNLGSAVFNTLLKWMSGLDLSTKQGNFRVFSYKVANAYRAYPEQMRLFPAIMSQVGFETRHLLLARAKREGGGSSYSFGKLVSLAFDAFTAYSDKPLRNVAFFGLWICLAAGLFGLYTILRALVFGIYVPGYASIVAILAFTSGFQIFLLGFVGVYVGRVLNETKHRPVFIVDAIVDARSSPDADVSLMAEAENRGQALQTAQI